MERESAPAPLIRLYHAIEDSGKARNSCALFSIFPLPCNFNPQKI